MNMNPRQRRLKADFEKMKDEFSVHKFISFTYEENLTGVPEKYFFYFHGLKSIKVTEDENKSKKAELITEHKIEIYLHIDYPRVKPAAYIHTPLFHPNFRMASPHDICIGDYWASGETLVDIVYQIGDLIMYQAYNINSPLNGIAAKWARENPDLLPLDNTIIRKPDPQIHLSGSSDNNEVKIDLL
ncbi:hypothetical protein BH10BAC5_BH10BAC5_29120 [soil metagenome]